MLKGVKSSSVNYPSFLSLIKTTQLFSNVILSVATAFLFDVMWTEPELAEGVSNIIFV
jgi:hypothetical protein